MDRHDELAGFCFRCSTKAPRFDPSRRKLTYNPWPLLAPSKASDYMHSQPLIRAFYSPTEPEAVFTIKQRRARASSDKEPHTVTDVYDFLDWFNYLHEFGHLWFLDWTPAKELAKIYLALSYDLLFQLMFDKKLSHRRAQGLGRELAFCTSRLREIAQNIGFVEELVATTVANLTMENQTRPGGMWAGFDEEFDMARSISLESEFGETYDRVVPLVDQMRSDPALAAFIIPLLQPVRISEIDSEPYAVNAREGLDTILDRLAGVESLEVAKGLLQDLSQETIASWQEVLGLQLNAVGEDSIDKDYRRISYYRAFAKALWKITRGALSDDPSDEWIADAPRRFQDHLATNHLPLGAGTLVILYPRVRARHHFVGLHWLDVGENFSTTPASDDLRRTHLGIVYCEGLRQQAVKGTGFACPYNVDGTSRCQCTRANQEALVRLSDLASDGVFGSGIWSRPPCRR